MTSAYAIRGRLSAWSAGRCSLCGQTAKRSNCRNGIARQKTKQFYTSPQTGNRWLLYISARKDNNGDVRLFYRSMLYYFTELYMTIMIAVTTCEENDDGERRNIINGVNVYTAHMFQRMADPDRLGVDMSDRIKVMRNFAEFVAVGWSDTRPPRKGEKFEQVMMRLPGSWLRGHVVEVGGRLVTIYRTFYTDRSMTPQQRKDVKSFKKFADGKLAGKERSKGTALAEPDNLRNDKVAIEADY